MVKHTREVDFKDIQNPELQPQILQVLNISLKEALRDAGMYQLGKTGKYFSKNQLGKHKDLNNIGLDIITGFKLTLTPLNRGITLQVDACSRVLQSKNLLETFNGKSQEEVINTFTKATVLTRYGIYKTYRIEEIDYKQNPKSKFHQKTRGEEISFKEYYEEVYGLRIMNDKQPLLKVISHIEKKMGADNKLHENPVYIYLIPELVSMTGMTDEQLKNHTTMRDLATYTKLSPDQRVEKCADVIKIVNNKSSMIKVKESMEMTAFTLDKPELEFGNDKMTPQANGSFQNRNKLHTTVKIADYLVLYSQGKDKKRADNEADDAIDLLNKAGKAYGVKFDDPNFLTVNSMKDAEKELIDDFKKNGSPSLVIVLLKPFEENMYGRLKELLVNKIECPSQFIRSRTLTNPKGSMSAASKICIQLTAKLGGMPWCINDRNNELKKNNIAYCGLSISTGKGGSVVSFVGMIKPDGSKLFSRCKTKVVREAINNTYL